MAKKLVAHWVGEFGWELFGFQGFMRSMSKDYDITIISRPGHRMLYEDFCKDFIPYTPSTNNTRFSKCQDNLPDNFYDQFEYDLLIPSQTDLVHWSPTKGFWGKNKIVKDYDQTFIRYGDQTFMFGYDILIHARNTNKLGSGGRNWGIDKWNELVKNLRSQYRIASIGVSGASMHIHGTSDMRNIDLLDLCGLMNQSRVVVGGSSGPIHCASLCGTPHVTWGAMLNKVRYERDWNPLGTKVLFYGDQEWNPDVNIIVNNVKKILQK